MTGTDLRSIHHPGALVGPLWAVAVGRGAPVVLLHGNSESHRVFDALVPHLAGSLTLVGLDSRGHGLSPRGERGLTIASMADDVAATLAALGLDRPVVVGFSDGGNIALELALRHPDAVGPLVVVGANLFPEGLTPFSKLTTDVAHAATVLGSRVAPALGPLAERLGLMVHDPRIDPDALGALTQPVLVVVGERDAIRPEHTALIVDSIPRARLAVVPGVGHMVPVRAPAALADLVRGVVRGSRDPGEVAG
ncbi:alpha/beta fold hydrolase [Serinibacter arcticus]|uniref:Alpha/beta superfamily hydrolase n=1 Tax=Serinibacter arcticus TaxID=1655435 RepID=A0A4Z1E1Z4_9MICO|nr:alpha/beta fold hydrolase [Serinibacter arcticus]TGO05916.1 Alpha/beta superfamily hydrolase [Serinibacter arcticus]